MLKNGKFAVIFRPLLITGIFSIKIMKIMSEEEGVMSVKREETLRKNHLANGRINSLENSNKTVEKH